MTSYDYSDLRCTSVPSLYIKSNGLMKRAHHEDDMHLSILSYSLPRLQLQIALILVAHQLSNYIFGRRFGLPKLFCHLFAGIILGETFLGRYQFMKAVFPLEGQRTIDFLATMGYLLFTFLAALKIDLKLVTRTGKTAVIGGISVIAAPLVFSFIYYQIILRHTTSALFTESYYINSFMYVTSVQSMTAFANIADLLRELNLVTSELGRLVMSAALVADMCNNLQITVVRLVQYVVRYNVQVLFKELGYYSGFFFFLVFIARPALHWIVKQTPQGKPVSDRYIYAILMMLFAIINITNYLGGFSLIALFYTAVIIPAGPPLGSTLVNKLETFGHSVLFPIFITTSGMRMNFTNIKITKFTIASLQITVVCIFVKVMVTLIVAKCCKMPVKDSVAFSALMSNKGAVEMAQFNELRDQKIIGDNLFTLLATIDVLNTIVASQVAKYFYDPKRKYAGYQKRSIMYLKPDADFKIVACVHRPDNVTALINLLDACYPTRESPIVADIIHLIELIGRATPVFFSNKLQTRLNSSLSYSGSVVRSFEHYLRDREEKISVDVITAISPPEYMHEDICYLALDRVASFIVLPFHQRWSMDGVLESESSMIRALNCSVLDTAPCSVGILVDHGNLGQSINQPVVSIAMVFRGGKDCREALTLAKRMAKNPKVRLTIIRFLFSDDDGGTNWDKLLDSEVLREVKRSCEHRADISYLEEKVDDGPQMALVLRDMVDKYDLFVVGRNYVADSSQTNGLSEWSDFRELGDIGDLLASIEFNSISSVLVVQKQNVDNGD